MDPLHHLRAHSGLRLDRDGAFWHEDQPVLHPRLIQVLRQGLGRDQAGRPIVRLGRQWAWLQVDDTLFRVRSCTARADPCSEALAGIDLDRDDDHRETLEPPHLRLALDAEGVLYVRVAQGAEWARCSPGVQATLGEFVAPSADGGWLLMTTVGGRPVELLPAPARD